MTMYDGYPSVLLTSVEILCDMRCLSLGNYPFPEPAQLRGYLPSMAYNPDFGARCSIFGRVGLEMCG
jgi:hypothetical protein